MLLTTLFSLGGLANNNEIIALKASGVSLYRILLVVAIPAFFISLLTLSGGQTVVPYFNKQRLDIERHQVNKIPVSSSTRRGRIYLIDGKDRFVFIGHFNGETNSAFNINIQTVVDNEIVSRVDAQKMVFQKNHWVVYDAVKRDFIAPDSVKVETIPVFDWRELAFTPTELLTIQEKPEEMNYRQLKEFTDKLVTTGANALRWKMDLKDKIATPFAALIVVIFGVPIAVVKRRSGIMVGFGISLLVCFLYFGLIHSGKILGYKGLVEPIYAAWGGHAVFLLVGIAAVLRARK
jgi:lipopolysaccharide export system permease protein